MADVRVRCSAVPDDGSNGVFWRDGVRWLRDQGQETLIASVAADRERKFMEDMDKPLGFVAMKVEREARDLSRRGPMDREATIYAELEGLLERHSMPFDEFLSMLAKAMRADAQEQEHQLVRSCLDSCAEHLDHASLDWYAHTK